ncbi:MAG TPA: O-antigen ligase family protein [Candidatus Dormibacteraeota bacterium]
MRPLVERLANFLPAAIALALPTVFVPWAVDAYILPRASIVIVGACVGAGIALLLPLTPSLGQLRLPLLAAAAAAILAFAFTVSWPLSAVGSYTRYESLPMRLAYLVLLAVPVWCLRSERPRELVAGAFVFGTSIASIEALLQVAGGVEFRPDGNIGNANLLGALIAMAFPLAVARALRFDRLVFAWWLAAAVMVGGLVASTSRSGGLGALAGCLALVVFALRGRVAVMAAAASITAMAVALMLVVMGPLGALNNDPARSRLQLWPDALRMIAARPITGWGEDATGLVFGRFLSADYSPGVTFDRVHSGPLDIAATMGLLGLIALGWVMVVLFRGVWQGRFSASVAAFGAACVGYSVWAVFNFDWAPATGVFWLLAGTAWSGLGGTEAIEATPAAAQGPLSSKAIRPLGALGLAVLAIALGLMPLLADGWYFNGRADLAVVADPLQSRYHWVRGEDLIAAGKAHEGLAELRRAAQLGETEPQLYVELGDEEKALGDPAQARRAYMMALAIDPYYAPAKQKLASLNA